MIDISRLQSRMTTMAEIGRTELGGVTRLALSEEDKRARCLLMKWMKDLGINVRIDDIGNIYGRKEGSNPEAPVIMTGSHLDSVPKGGKFDGVLGVLGALEAVETLIKNGISHEHPIEIVCFTNEEGARFTPQMLGSGAVTGVFSKSDVYGREDSLGLKFHEELQKIGFMGEHKNRLCNVGAYLELHIEQGPVLEAEECPIGIVEGICGFHWMEVRVSGQSSHSATTPMAMRKDSLVASSQMIDRIYRWALSKQDGITATVGQIHCSPGIVNAVAGKTTFTVDIRHPDPEKLQDSIREIKELFVRMADDTSMDVSIQEIMTHPPVSFSPRMVSLLSEMSEELHLPYKYVMSGAGHDAMYVSRIADTAMIFVPSIDGKSHCEEEETAWRDIEKGVQLLYRTVCELAM